MKRKRLVVFMLIILLLGTLAYYKTDIQGNVIIDYPKENATVLRIIDGDTIETDLGMIRLLGINTPEKGKFYYSEAKEYLQKIENQSIQILRDKTNYDKYDRKLRYVFYENKNLNIALVERGFGTAYMTEELRYEEKILRAQKLAQDQESRIWKKSNEKCASCINLIELNAEDEFFILENSCDYGCDLNAWYVKDASRNVFYLDMIYAKRQQTINSTKHVWNNDHDEFFLRDKNGLLVIHYSY